MVKLKGFKLSRVFVNHLMSTEVKSPASDSITDFDYIKQIKGVEGFNDAVELFNKYSPIKYDELIKHKTKFINMGISALIYYIPIHLWGWGKKEIKAMGQAGFRLSFLVKFLVRNILNTNTLIKQSSKIFNQYFTKGSLVVESITKNKFKIIISDFNVDPLVIIYLEGYFKSMIEFSNKELKVSVKTQFSKENHHVLIAEWH